MAIGPSAALHVSQRVALAEQPPCRHHGPRVHRLVLLPCGQSDRVLLLLQAMVADDLKERGRLHGSEGINDHQAHSRYALACHLHRKPLGCGPLPLSGRPGDRDGLPLVRKEGCPLSRPLITRAQRRSDGDRGRVITLVETQDAGSFWDFGVRGEIPLNEDWCFRHGLEEQKLVGYAQPVPGGG